MSKNHSGFSVSYKMTMTAFWTHKLQLNSYVYASLCYDKNSRTIGCEFSLDKIKLIKKWARKMNFVDCNNWDIGIVLTSLVWMKWNACSNINFLLTSRILLCYIPLVNCNPMNYEMTWTHKPDKVPHGTRIEIWIAEFVPKCRRHSFQFSGVDCWRHCQMFQ